MQSTQLCTLRNRRSDWIGFLSFSVWTLVNAATAIGVFRRNPAVAVFLLPTFAHEAVVAVCFLLRKPLLRQIEGWVPRVSAYVATLITPAFYLACSHWFPRWIKSSPLPLLVVGMAFWVVGAYLGTWCVFHLRSAFSIEPQARTLVTNGPYRLARHPVYASYLLQYAGVMLAHLTPATVTVFFLWLVVVTARISYEESVLTAAFPRYEEYRRRVGRFAPRPTRKSLREPSAPAPALSTPTRAGSFES
jgi:protein-S-isoprenylcysteine O-methyltransferase Ste14